MFYSAFIILSIILLWSQIPVIHHSSSTIHRQLFPLPLFANLDSQLLLCSPIPPPYYSAKANIRANIETNIEANFD